jgi:hypothetical protein
MDTADCVAYNLSAAAEKLPSVTVQKKVSSCCKVTFASARFVSRKFSQIISGQCTQWRGIRKRWEILVLC